MVNLRWFPRHMRQISTQFPKVHCLMSASPRTAHLRTWRWKLDDGIGEIPPLSSFLYLSTVYTKTHPHPVKQAYPFSSFVLTKPF